MKNAGWRAAAVAAAAATLSGASAAQQAPPGPPPTPAAKPCSSAEHRQFDFWAGSWDVFGPKGKQVGKNEIRPILGGCALQENWTGAGGVSGTSLNAWDAGRERWHQTWVDSGGDVLYLDGRFADGRMVLSGSQKGADGAAVENRITWERVGGSPDRVRQLWESSRDGGKTWTIAFDGTYVRRK